MAYELIVADNNTLFGEGLKKILQERAGLRVVGEASDNLGLLNLLKETDSHVILLDLFLSNLRLSEVVSEIRRMHPDTKILIMGMGREKEYVSQAFAAGADGYLLKDEAYEELISAIETILEGGNYVPPSLRRAST
ncbi:MAG: hypothetical protein A2156_16260 [Deltaproteobacteria bacterium RBG_16_48_10]|nr:MAG: hypothetical protein A2156_16260 [Deltaproteobacteria bacterium RBG_16_48_10]